MCRNIQAAFFGAWLAAHFFISGDTMFDNQERIEHLSYEEYKKALYYFKHPAEYPGDFAAFRDNTNPK